jgi:uncharacterized protein YciI
VEFFVCSRAASHVADLDDDPALDEAHWSYMDRFAAGMIARGPLLGPDRESWLGSVHIVALPSVVAAHEFVEREPYNRAGAYTDHLIRRFDNRLGRTMWDFPGPSREPRFMVISHTLTAQQRQMPSERLIVHGELRTPDGAKPAGAVWALHAPAREAVSTLFDRDVEIIDWEFGGRR